LVSGKLAGVCRAWRAGLACTALVAEFWEAFAIGVGSTGCAAFVDVTITVVVLAVANLESIAVLTRIHLVAVATVNLAIAIHVQVALADASRARLAERLARTLRARGRTGRGITRGRAVDADVALAHLAVAGALSICRADVAELVDLAVAVVIDVVAANLWRRSKPVDLGIAIVAVEVGVGSDLYAALPVKVLIGERVASATGVLDTKLVADARGRRVDRAARTFNAVCGRADAAEPADACLA